MNLGTATTPLELQFSEKIGGVQNGHNMAILAFQATFLAVGTTFMRKTGTEKTKRLVTYIGWW